MIRLAAAIMSLLCITLAACDAPERSGADLSSPEGLARYLRHIPAARSVEPWQNPHAPGITITTAHYTIHTTLTDPLMLRQLPAFVESAYAAYQSQLPEPIDTQTRFVTYLFADRAQWEAFTEVFAAPNAEAYLKIVQGAYCLNGACVAYNIGRTRTFAALGHEGWHQFNSKHFAYRLPSWLDEGIATLFEASRYDQGVFEFLPRGNADRLASLKIALARGTVGLEELITLNPGQVVHDAQAAKGFYAQAYALVRFLREADYGKRLANYHNLLLGGLRGNWPLDPQLQRIAADRNIPLTTAFNRNVSPALFTLYIDDNMERIEAEYLGFCLKITDSH
ncbi:MAG: DUF1570 domain-containing protein [Phycisphaerae bacterium]|nr:DUF1570 domain-containing protein [Phycisphaerae bacterium]